MVQVSDTLDSLAGEGGFSLHASDGRLNVGLAHGLTQLGVPVQAVGEFTSGLSTSFGRAVAGLGLSSEPRTPQPVLSPHARLNRAFG